MRLIRWLDDLDTRVIGRGDPNWRSPTSKPWTPEIGPLVRVTRGAVAGAAVIGIIGLAALTLDIASGDGSVVENAVLFLVCLALFWFLRDRELTSLAMETTVPVPADVPISPWWKRLVCSPLRTGALVALLALLVVALAYNEDGTNLTLVSSLFLAQAVIAFRRGRTLAEWEDERGVELLRPLRQGWSWGPPGYYVRPQSGTNDKAGHSGGR